MNGLKLTERKPTKTILECGIDDETFGPKECIGGYYIEEFQGLIDALKPYNPSKCLSIGIASGGADRYVCENLPISHLVVIDDGKHPRYSIWNDVNKPALKCKVDEYIGDSHDYKAEQFLSNLNQKYDLIGIDGDHSPCGVRLDWMLIEPYLKAGSIVWLHDIAWLQGPLELWNMMKCKFNVIYENTKRIGIGAVRV